MATQQIELPGTQALVRRNPEPLEILQAAVDKNLSPETLKQLMDLQERWEANEAKKEFIEAMSLFKANPPKITKNKHVEFGTTKFDHATLDHVCEMIVPALSAVGISHRWVTKQADGRIQVTCTLTHKSGHSVETTLDGPPDNSGSKNSLHAIASSVTYLERYTLLAAVGLAAEGTDDDGQAAGEKMDDLSERLEWIENSSNYQELESIFKDAYKKAKTLHDEKAMIAIVKAKDARKKELRGQD